jgi:hypothetical protein
MISPVGVVIFAHANPSSHLVYSLKIAPPTLSATVLALGMPAILHDTTDPAHGVSTHGMAYGIDKPMYVEVVSD